MSRGVEDFANEGLIATQLQNAGLSGAGGGGFPAYTKWKQRESADYLLVNHQESEKNCYVDKWLGRHRVAELAELFDGLLADCLETVIVGAKLSDRTWTGSLEAESDGEVYLPEDLTISPDDQSGVECHTECSKHQSTRLPRSCSLPPGSTPIHLPGIVRLSTAGRAGVSRSSDRQTGTVSQSTPTA